MTFESTILHDYKDFEAPEPVGLGNGRTVSAIGVGKVKVIAQLHNGRSVVCWMTKLTNNLFSVRTYMQQLLKGTQCHLHTRAAAFRVNTERSLVLDHPWASCTSLIVKYNSHLLKRLQLLKLV